MATNKSTRQILLSLIDDMELIAKEMIENTIAQKHLKLSGTEYGQLVQLLVAKNNDLKSMLKQAAEQEKINIKMEALKAEVDKQDQDIQQLQRQLKEAEQILATAIYQAKQKLESIAQANKKPVPSEELIKFAHRISASNAVCAPLTWQQGYLGRLSDLPLNGSLLGSHPGMPADLHRAGAGSGTGSHPEPPASLANQFAWHPSGESMNITMGGGAGQGSVPINTHKQENEDVEVMSTDSSSSSSSDSQ
ncbi:Similar to MED4: Mediator of RNA polymerase II transcription subunit 4 (Anopheles gambiae) [Cotesia congregata]|uniref:Mediator of RNA polymerase II transcription subunit 4 n=1 Tax=Cotesia congregata TaxID=51543 RepID=A0A8J2MT31_COTCN|nr:Similar to MED4: Mediator of RNA polymerase II transcription subunit 4 (Anopheles gambiae) [Cotesia congregata]